MSRLCTICASDRRASIDEALATHRLSYRRIAARFGLVETSLRRHERAHLRISLEASRTMQALVSVERLAARIQQGDAAVDRVMARSETAGDDRLLLAAVRELRMNVEALAKIATASELEAQVRDVLAQLDAALAAKAGGQTDG